MHCSEMHIFRGLVLAAVLVLSGCNTTQVTPATVSHTTNQERFDGPGGTAVHDFVKASMACERETSRVNQDNSAHVLPSCSAVVRCLAAKGYVSSPSGQFDAEQLRTALTCTVP